MSINSKNKSGDYYDNVVNHKPKQVRSKFFKNVNNSTDNKNKSKESLTFNAITRVFMLALFTLIMVLGFTNGTLDFIQDHKEVYAVENYVKPNITSLADVDGKTFKFNDDVYLYEYGNTNPLSNNFGLDINLNNLSLITNNTLLFKLYNSTQSFDFFIKPNWSSVNYRVFLNGYQRGFSFRNINLSLVYYGYYDDNNKLVWSSDYFSNLNDDFYITFSNDFSTFIRGGINNISFNERAFYNFLNYQTTIKNDIYSDEYYYYDWRFKLKQLSNFRPLFDASALLDEYNGKEYTKLNYQSTLQDYYSNGYVTYNGSIAPNYINWFPTDLGEQVVGDKELRNFLRAVAYWRGISPVYASSCFTLENDVVVPSFWYQAWNEDDNAETINSKFNDYLDGIIGFLYSPINLTYNVYVFFDFILRW